MVSNTKKLLCIVFIWLILPFASVLHNPMQDVAAASEPTVTILDVTSDDTYRITVTVELSLTDYNYDYYINELRLYLNQSSKTINETNNFNSYNSSKTLNRPDEAVFETEILSPVLSDGSHEDSAYYNITIVAITETDVKSELAEWSGGYYFIDTELPSITFISPSVAYEEIWGIYTVEVNVTDLSNISMVSFYVDNSIRKKITDPTPGQVAFTWDWLCANHTRGDHFIKVRARDASDALNKKDLSFSVTIVGPELDYVEGPAEDYTIVSRPPNTIDENETLIISTLVEDANYDINTTILRYSLDDGPFQEIIFNNPLADNYYNALISEGNFTVGTKINFEIYVNNSVGQYHLFRNETLQPWELYAQYPDHIPPEGEIFYTRNITLGDPVSVEANITEQSPVTNCEIHYQITSEGEWIETDMTLIDSSFNSSDWFYYQYNFTEEIEVFQVVYFYIVANDTGNNSLVLNNDGANYRIKIFSSDLTPPNITITEIPDSITQSSSFTIKATIEDASELESVCLMYTIRGQVFQVNMTYNEEEDVWSATITITGNTGETVDLWIRATDIYYNTADSEIESFELQSEKSGLGHSNAWLWLIFLVLLIAPIVLTIVLLKPQK